jgi:hypothetical protein
MLEEEEEEEEYCFVVGNITLLEDHQSDLNYKKHFCSCRLVVGNITLAEEQPD